MKETVERIERNINDRVNSNTLATAWLSGMVIRRAKMHCRSMKHEEIAAYARNKLDKMENAWFCPALLPDTISDLIDDVKTFRQNIGRVAQEEARAAEESRACRMLAAIDNSLKPWDEIMEHVNKACRSLEAMADFTDSDNIDDFPYCGYEMYTELKEIDYLSRMLRA